MAEQDYKERGIFETTLIVSEALMSAVMHGTRANPRKRVVMSYLVALDRMLFDIQDERTGFDPASVPLRDGELSPPQVPSLRRRVTRRHRTSCPNDSRFH
jgi:anti-sigma regulatory factor (Ser/Thr protein kinase)